MNGTIFLEGAVLARTFGLLLLLLIGCGAEDPSATKYRKQMGEPSAIKQRVLVGWNEPIYSTKFGLAPNPNIDGRKLAEVITSQKPGRDDGMLCSGCHNKDDAQGGYGVPAEKNAASPSLKPTDMIDGRSWVGPDGWAVRFVKNSTKPANVKAVVQAWIDNNYK